MPDTIQDIPIAKASGGSATLRDYAGQVLLIVNVASKCGLTPQYEGLEALYRQYRERGFTVLGFPANDFMGQEPGTDAEIQAFCRLTYAIDFPVFAKLGVTGDGKHPLYAALIRAQPKATSTNDGGMRDGLAAHGIVPTREPEVLWNFEKFLIGRSGDVVARFAPDTAPDDPALVSAVERELGRNAG